MITLKLCKPHCHTLLMIYLNLLIALDQDKEKYVVHILALKQALNHGLILKKVHRVIEFRQEAWLKPYIDMNTKLRM